MRVVTISPEIEEDRRERAGDLLRGKAEILFSSAATLAEGLGRADAYLCLGFDREFPMAPSAYRRVRFVQTLWAGVDRIPFERLPDHVMLCSNAGAFSTSLSEQAFALLLAAAKRVVLHATDIRQGRFTQERASKQLRGSTLGIVGLGSIGKEVARLGQAFGMRVIGITRSGQSDFAADFVGGPGDLDRILEESDFVVITVPHTKETHHLIAAGELGRMKPDAVLVNVCRGPVVKEDDLYEHLSRRPSFHAATDVWWQYPKGQGFPYALPFHELPNFFGTPHVGWNVPPQRMHTLEVAIQNLRAWIDGGPVQNTVKAADYRRTRAGDTYQ